MNQNNNHSYQKFTKNDKPNYNKPSYSNNTPDNQKSEPKKSFYSQPNPAQPMEIDPSLKSRLTLNKKIIHNNETLDPDNSEHSDSEEENEVNFWQTVKNTPET